MQKLSLKKLTRGSYLILLTSLMIACLLQACGGRGICAPQIPGDRRITMNEIGEIGRFGNQLYQYIFLKVYAKRHGLIAETPSWIGNQLYGLQDPTITTRFCRVTESQDLLDSFQYTTNQNFSNLDFTGYYQIHTSLHAPDRDYIQSLFVPTKPVLDIVDPALALIRGGHKTLVGIHLRRGDFGPPPFLIPPSQWYIDWLNQIWSTLDDPVLFIASDDLDAVTPDFLRAGYAVRTIRDTQAVIPEADFFPEHYILSHSDVLAISNSTFSTTSALFNTTGTQFYRPKYTQKKLVAFDPWNTLPWENWTEGANE